jgi:cephalosporin hydroxylase
MGRPDFWKQALALARRDPRDAVRKTWRYLRPRRSDYRARLRMTLADWLLYHQHHVSFAECRWMGVKAYKSPLDAWILQEILFEVKPDVVVEIGSAEGGSTLYIASLMDLIGKGKVLSIDIDRTRFAAVHSRNVTLTGDSSSAPIVSQATEVCRGQSVLVVHDGDHRKEPVLRDLEAYAPLVSVGSYLIVEDGVIDLFRPGDGIGGFGDGPLAASEDFLARHPEFEVDASRERYLATYNPRGYLRRKR